MAQSPTIATGERDSYESGWAKIRQLVDDGGTWSGHERNCCFLNTGAAEFANVSAVTGLDFLDDGRCIAPVDWDLDGDLDLWLSARTGPRLRFVRNDIRHAGDQDRHYLAVKLVGQTCNRDAVGARVELIANGHKLIRTLRAGDGYMSQASKWIHFGLGDATKLESLTVRWPGGDVEQFQGSKADARWVLVQGRGQAEPWHVLDRQIALKESRLDGHAASAPNRIVLLDRVPLPPLDFKDFQDQDISLPRDANGPVLVNLWATWCAPCLGELNDFKNAAEQIRQRGVQVVALSVDGLGEGDTSDISQARLKMQQLEFPFQAGAANPDLLNKLDVFQEVFLSLRTESFHLPMSFLIDEFGRLAVIYLGAVDVARLLSDVAMLSAPPPESLHAAFPFAGRWVARPRATGELLVQLAGQFRDRKDLGEAARFAGLAADLATRDGIPPALIADLATIFFEAGNSRLEQGSLDTARRYLRQAVSLRPDWAEAHTNLGNVYRQLGANDAAENHFGIAIRINPRLLQPHFNMGVIRLNQRQNAEAAAYFQTTIQINPNFAAGHNYLGVALARVGRREESINQLLDALRLGDAEAQHNLDSINAGQMP